MECVFERHPSNPKLVRCKRPDCGAIMHYSHPDMAKYHAKCRSGDTEAQRRWKESQSKRPAVKRRNTVEHPCIYQGDPTGESVVCGGCGGGLRSLFTCDVFGACLPMNVTEGYHSCLTCGEYKAEP